MKCLNKPNVEYVYVHDLRVGWIGVLFSTKTMKQEKTSSISGIFSLRIFGYEIFKWIINYWNNHNTKVSKWLCYKRFSVLIFIVYKVVIKLQLSIDHMTSFQIML